eukprot:750120-Amphidinium_carterae.2
MASEAVAENVTSRDDARKVNGLSETRRRPRTSSANSKALTCHPKQTSNSYKQNAIQTQKKQ